MVILFSSGSDYRMFNCPCSLLNCFVVFRGTSMHGRGPVRRSVASLGTRAIPPTRGVQQPDFSSRLPDSLCCACGWVALSTTLCLPLGESMGGCGFAPTYYFFLRPLRPPARVRSTVIAGRASVGAGHVGGCSCLKWSRRALKRH